MAATASRLRSAPLRHDGATDVYGVFSSTRRVQPRYQDKAKASQYDHMATERARQEMEAKTVRAHRIDDVKSKAEAEDAALGSEYQPAPQGTDRALPQFLCRLESSISLFLFSNVFRVAFIEW